MARCFVTRRLPGDALTRLASVHEVDVWPERLPPSPAELAAHVEPAEGLLSLLTDRIDAALLERAPRLTAIANYAVGYDNIDLQAAEAHGIAVGNTPDVLTDATADLTFALLMAAARRLPEAVDSVRQGDWLTWEPARYLGAAVHGAVLGIVGFGRIGQALARRAEGFDMEVIHTGAIELSELLERADFVSLHTPLTPDTRHLIDADGLARMKSTAILVNTARGEIVDLDALADALHGGQIAGVALDVTDPEPLPPGHRLLGAPNVIVTPHIGSATRATRERMADIAVDNLLAALDGRPMPYAVPMPA